MAAALNMLKGGGGALGSAAMGLFKPKDVANAAIGAAVSQAVSSATNKKIEWEQYNWPLKADYGGLIHFDLVELREKRDAGIFNMINSFYAWWRFTMILLGINAVTTFVLTVSGQPAYSGVNLLAALAWLVVVGVSYMACVYKAYHGWAENSRVSQLIARALIVVTVTLALIQCFGAFGNINGWAGFASGRYSKAATDGMPAGVVSYWQAMSVLESLAWLGNIGVQLWMTYRMIMGPVAGAQAAPIASHTTKKAAAPAPAPVPAAAGATAPPAPAPAGSAAAAPAPAAASRMFGFRT